MNGNPIRGLIADGLPAQNIVQIGLQSFANSLSYADYAQEQRIRGIRIEDMRERTFQEVFERELTLIAPKVQVIYLDIDLDVMDVAFAPGCPGARPGGLTPQDIRLAARIAGGHPKVKAIDIVELDPERPLEKLTGATAMTAALCILEFAAGMSQEKDRVGL
jgi:arginase family enzyme